MNVASESGAENGENTTNGASSLGYDGAVDIVCTAAGNDPCDLSRTLKELGLNGPSFQQTVFNGIGKAGYTIDLDSIPDSQTSTLLSVVAVIEYAKPA